MQNISKQISSNTIISLLFVIVARGAKKIAAAKSLKLCPDWPTLIGDMTNEKTLLKLEREDLGSFKLA